MSCELWYRVKGGVWWWNRLSMCVWLEFELFFEIYWFFIRKIDFQPMDSPRRKWMGIKWDKIMKRNFGRLFKSYAIFNRNF